MTQDMLYEDSSKIFVGVRFVLIGFDPHRKEQVTPCLIFFLKKIVFFSSYMRALSVEMINSKMDTKYLYCHTLTRLSSRQS